jgi:hypothetical protein
VPFQVDPMLIPMFGRGNLSKKFAAGGGAKSGVGTAPSEESQQTTGEYIKGLYKENIPVHARVYLETLLGKKDPITAEDFTKEELADIEKLLSSKPAKGAVTEYSDYEKVRDLDREGRHSSDWLENLPSVGKTLGRFTYETLPDGRRVIKDTYDFYNTSRSINVQEFEEMGPAEKALAVFKRITADRSVMDPPFVKRAADVLGEAYIGRDGRPVKVEYDPKDLPVKRQDGSPSQGEISDDMFVGTRPSDINAPSINRLREFIEIQKPTIDANRPDMFPYDPLGLKSQERILQMGRGGPIKSSLTGIKKAQEAAKKATKKRTHPTIYPPAKPLSDEDIRAMAQRMAEQTSGEFFRPDPKQSVNPAGKSQKQFQRDLGLSKQIGSNIQDPNIPVVDVEKRLGSGLVGVPGDPTLGGVLRTGSLTQAPKGTKELLGIEDVNFDVPVQLFGGPRYGAESQMPSGVDTPFWASMQSPASAIQNQVTALSEKLGGVPIASMYTKMTPESSNYAMHMLDSLLAYQQPHRLSKAKREQLDQVIRAGDLKGREFPGFPGFENPEDVLLQARMNPKLRKHISNTLFKPKFTEPLGLRPGLDALSAISHPEIENLPPGTSGFSMGLMRPGAPLSKSSHPTYSTDIPGEFIGASKYPIPLELAFPRTTSYVRENIPTGELFNTSKMAGMREVIDPQYVDQIKLYEEFMKRYTGKKKGGAVRKGALAAVLS